MNFSDDPATPGATFGDSSVFDVGDMVSQSPTTDERVVDTQSGFLVVVRRLNHRLALSVKRRIGTPPTSSIALTPDESLTLSRVLATSIQGLPEEEAEGRRSRARSAKLARLHDDDYDDGKAASRLRSRKLVLPIALGCIACLVVGGLIGFAVNASKPAPAAIKAVEDPLATETVDRFVRNFVACMLDFSPKTYRQSQVTAMAAMNPELLERYWKETNFPLTQSQLGRLPQGMTILISELSCERVDQSTVDVKVHAQLNDPNNAKASTPVNLGLKLGLGDEGKIVVLEQTDLSSK